MKQAAWLLSAVVLTGCASAPMFRMSSLEPGLRESQLRELERSGPGEVSVVATFDRVWDGFAVFRVTIANHSGSRVSVDPAEFFVTLSASPSDSITGEEHVHAAVQPGAVVARADRLLDEERSAQAVGAFFGLLSLVADAVSEFSNDESRDCAHGDECSCCREARRREERERSARESQAARGRLQGLSEQLAYWDAQVLRPSFLEPGRAADGMVAFPLDPLLRFRPERAQPPGRRAHAAETPRKTFGLVLHCPLGSSTHRIRFAVYRY